jgi:hypothetical protein
MGRHDLRSGQPNLSQGRSAGVSGMINSAPSIVLVWLTNLTATCLMTRRLPCGTSGKNGLHPTDPQEPELLLIRSDTVAT